MKRKNSLKLKRKTMLIVLLGILSVLLVYGLAFGLNSKAGVAYASGTTITEVNEEQRFNTVYFNNGSVRVGILNINHGDTYSVSRYGYSINGVYSDLSGKMEMDKCAYNGYYGSPFINEVEIATYGGWILDGNYLTEGVWNCDIFEENIINVYSKWTPKLFTARLNYYTGNYDTVDFNYIDGLELPDRIREGYRFNGWQDEKGDIYKGTVHNYTDVVFTESWSELFTVILKSNTHTTYNKTYSGIRGEKFVLPNLTYGNYKVVSWGTFGAGTTYTIVGDVTLFAVWKGNEYSILYNNLTFLGKTAEVYYNSFTAPTKFEYGVGLDLTNLIALWRTNTPYTPQLVFLGWYTDLAFGTKITSISATHASNVNLYAKWRYDFDYPGRRGESTITNADPLTQFSDQIYVGLNQNNLYNNLQTIGIRYITIKVKIKMYEKKDGAQTIFLYGGQDGNIKLREYTFSGESYSAVYECRFTVPLSDIGKIDYLYLRYQGSTTWLGVTRNWVNEQMYSEISYVREENDIYSPEFYWSYQDPF